MVACEDLSTMHADKRTVPPGNAGIEHGKMVLAGIFISIFLLTGPAQGKPTIVNIDVPSATETAAFSINSSGVIFGMAVFSSVQHAFLRAPDGTFTMFDIPGAVAGPL